jgi:surface antigen
MITKVKLLIMVSMILALAACTKQEVGTVAGGATGALIGSQFGSGSGKVAAAAAGTLIGALIGGNIGKTMDKVDRMEMSRALENNRTGQSTGWTNPDSGNSYSVQPTKTYQANNGQPCREYTTTAVIDGRQERIKGTACRSSDGSWRVGS